MLNVEEIVAVFQSFVSNKKELMEIASSVNFAFARHFVDLTKDCLESTVLFNDIQLLQIESILDFLHDQLYTGKWSSIELKFRRAFSVASLAKTVILLTCGALLENCLKSLDLGLLLGAPLTENADLLTRCAALLSNEIMERKEETNPEPRKRSSTDENTQSRKRFCGESDISGFNKIEAIEIETVNCLSPVKFHSEYLIPQKPVKITGCMDDWPAVTKWKDVDYLLKVAGGRTVPVEIGSQYDKEEWSQKLMTFQEFMTKYYLEQDEHLGYLAQHNLFDQIPELRSDIDIPDYCNFTDDDCDPDINAWFGPKGTVSPLHHDIKNNILAQVFGVKQVILFSPKDTPYLYPYEDKLLSNTAKVDPLQPDLKAYPEFNNATMYKCLLGPGEFLFLPQKWWHHITALDKSFSVSFWWL